MLLVVRPPGVWRNP